MDIFHEVVSNNNNSIDSFFKISTKSNNIIDWMDWILEGNLPFEFVSWPSTRRNTKLQPITPKLLKEKMAKLQKCLEEKIRSLLPSKFGLLFDGWTDTNIHYVAVYAAIPNDSPILLWFLPLENQECLSAESYVETWDAIMIYYNQPASSVAFVVGDNCSTNIKAARLCGVPIIRCPCIA
jgi:hypothetical protein